MARTRLKNCPGSPVPFVGRRFPLQIGPNPPERDGWPEGGTTGGGGRLESSEPAGDSSEGGVDGESWGRQSRGGDLHEREVAIR
jgi:hypothetical protein